MPMETQVKFWFPQHIFDHGASRDLDYTGPTARSNCVFFWWLFFFYFSCFGKCCNTLFLFCGLYSLIQHPTFHQHGVEYITSNFPSNPKNLSTDICQLLLANAYHCCILQMMLMAQTRWSLMRFQTQLMLPLQRTAKFSRETSMFIY